VQNVEHKIGGFIVGPDNDK